MSPVTSAGRWYNDNEAATRAEVASAARTTTGTSAEFNSEDADALLATLVVSAVSGTSPTLAVSLETTVDGTNWYAVNTYPTQTGTNGSGVGRGFAPLGDRCRWAWTIGGTTPSFTFAITAKAQQD